MVLRMERSFRWGVNDYLYKINLPCFVQRRRYTCPRWVMSASHWSSNKSSDFQTGRRSSRSVAGLEGVGETGVGTGSFGDMARLFQWQSFDLGDFPLAARRAADRHQRGFGVNDKAMKKPGM